jgi:hypothetical protein
MPRFTKENARDFATKGNRSRWSSEARLKRRQLQEALCRDFPEEIPRPPAIKLPDPDSEQIKRLICVRKEIELCDELFLVECLKRRPDARSVHRLASALALLSEIERVLAGRPLPGSLRPSNPSRDLRLMRRVMASPMIEPTPAGTSSTNGQQHQPAAEPPQPTSPPAQAQAQASSATSTEAPGAEAPSQGQASTQEQTQATKPEQSEGEGTEGRNS